jgi:aryl-alcohol dehydrogenase-like predicted oxidoreductase
MQQHELGRAARTVSVVGLGTWQLGADWGSVSEADALAVLEASAEAGVTFFDTADVYGDGRSETIIGRFRAAHPEWSGTVATKMGRRVDQVPENYTLKNFRRWLDRSRANLRMDTLDLVQLHCPPTPVYSDDEVFDALDTLVDEGVIANYGVSVERCDEALTAIARPNVASVQIILNAFRLKPLEQVLPAAEASGVAIIARVPLASGLLSGRYTKETTFSPQDHRSFNRHGEAFDVGETFSGVDYDTGVEAAQRFADAVASARTTLGVDCADKLTPAKAAIAWVAQRPGVSSVIPGARNVDQARSNAAAGSLAPLGEDFDRAVHEIYDEYIRASVHGRW